MAEDLDDALFWLPSHFLADDDILMDFKSPSSGFGFASGSSSDLVSLTTETETETSDDDDLVLSSGLTRQFPGSKPGLLGSPQSTLCGWELTRQCWGSIQGTPPGPVSPPKKPAKEETGRKKDVGGADGATLDLLNKAAVEVAKMKLRSQKPRSNGTGFFDCSNNGKTLFYPTQPPLFTSTFYPPHPQSRCFPPHMMWGPVQSPPPPQQRQIQNRVTAAATKTNKNNVDINNRPLGLPPSAWPPLPGQAQAQPESPQPKTQAQTLQPPVQPKMGLFPGPPQSFSVGTGVFLPRQVNTTVIAEPKKKSDGNVMKTKNKNPQSRNSRPTKANNDEIQLPSEWVY